MDQTTIETTEQAKSEDSGSTSSSDARSDIDSKSLSEKEEDCEENTMEKTRSLLSKLEDFKQSYNRTHGQVCEFLERARVVQKLGLLESSQASKLLSLSDNEEADNDVDVDCNSLADCNNADGQKTTGMKRKLRKWRKVMRSALSEICPELGLETQTDISPGLMKHIVDEVRNLKSQLAFQHNNILQLAQKNELYLQDCHEKEQFIADLLQNCKGIRFENSGVIGATEHLQVESSVDSLETKESDETPLPESLDEIQFGRSKELLNTLCLDPASFINGQEVESIVVQPMDFNELSRRQGNLVQSDSALDTGLTQIHELHDTQQDCCLNRNTNCAQVARQTNRGTNRSTSKTIVDTTQSTTCRANSGSCRTTTSPSVGLASSKKRNIFMSLGGTITVAVLGVAVAGTLQKKLFFNKQMSCS
eukprot:g7031.t1